MQHPQCMSKFWSLNHTCFHVPRWSIRTGLDIASYQLGNPPWQKRVLNAQRVVTTSNWVEEFPDLPSRVPARYCPGIFLIESQVRKAEFLFPSYQQQFTAICGPRSTKASHKPGHISTVWCSLQVVVDFSTAMKWAVEANSRFPDG